MDFGDYYLVYRLTNWPEVFRKSLKSTEWHFGPDRLAEMSFGFFAALDWEPGQDGQENSLHFDSLADAIAYAQEQKAKKKAQEPNP